MKNNQSKEIEFLEEIFSLSVKKVLGRLDKFTKNQFQEIGDYGQEIQDLWGFAWSTALTLTLAMCTWRFLTPVVG